MRLLPTCSRWSDFGTLLEAVITMALHGQVDSEAPMRLHISHDALVDRLIDDYRAQCTPQLFLRLRYPLGVLRLFVGDPNHPRSLENGMFEAAIGIVLGTLLNEMPESKSPALIHKVDGRQRCPICAPLNRTCTLFHEIFTAHTSSSTVGSIDETPQTCNLGLAEGAVSKDGTSHVGLHADSMKVCVAIQHPNMTVGTEVGADDADSGRKSERRAGTMRVTRGDLNLAEVLLKLCEGSLDRWIWMLDAVVHALSKFGKASSRCCEPLERLLVAFAEIKPGVEVLLALNHAAFAGWFSEAAAGAAVPGMWAATRQRLTSELNDVKSTNNDITTAWLEFPPPRPIPPAPIAPWKRVHSDRLFAVGRYVEISERGLFARHRDDTGDEMHGVVFGKKPITLTRTGLYFELELVEVRPEEMQDGLTVGVTASVPSDVFEAPVTLDHLDETWAVGYDGQMWDSVTSALRDAQWDPRTLQAGDVVGVLVTVNAGELLVFRNGVACCPGPRGIPVGKRPLYAAVDLLGAARAIRWHPDAEPPIDR